MGLKKYDAEAIKAQEEKELEAKKALEAAKEAEETTEEEPEIVEEEPLELDEIETKVNEMINAKKTTYTDYMKKQKTLNTVTTATVLVTSIGGMILVLLNDKIKPLNLGLGLGMALMFLGLIATFIVGKVLKSKRTEQALDYVDVLYQETNKYIFNNKEFKDYVCEPRQQVESTIFTDARFYKNIRGTRSRNYVSFTYKDHKLQVADLAGNILIKNRTSPMFLGKFYDYSAKYDKKDTRILFQLIGKELSRPVDDIEDLKVAEKTKKYVVYTNDDQWKKVLTERVMRELTSFRIDSTLIDVIVSIRDGKVSLGIDYSDQFMDVPVNSDINFDNFRRAKKDFDKVLKIFDLLNE